MIQPFVSVVIPSYNYGRFVCATVDSALAQTYKNLEVIVVDDGSTDNTCARLKPYGRRIRYIHQQNRGLPAARNTGIRAACGEWIALLDADDLWHPRKIEVQLQAAARHGVPIVGAQSTDSLTALFPEEPPTRRLTLHDFLTHSACVTGSSALIRRDCFNSTGFFDESLTSVEDLDMWLRLAVRYPALDVLAPCWWYRSHPNQMNRNPERMFNNYKQVLYKFFDAHPEFSHHRSLAWSHLHLDTALSYLSQGHRPKAIAFLLRSWARRPWSIDDSGRSWYRTKILIRLLLGDRLFHRLHGVMRTISPRPQIVTPPTPSLEHDLIV